MNTIQYIKRTTALLVAFLVLGAVPVVETVNDMAGNTLGIATVQAAAKSWDFSKDIGGWAYAGNYSYNGKAVVAYDSAFGGSLKLSVDYSADVAATWSEVKLSDKRVNNQTPIVAEKADSLTFDLYYDPAKINKGSLLKIKVYGKTVGGEEAINTCVDNLGMDHAEAMEGSNYKVVHVKVPFDDAVSEKIGQLEVSVVGYCTSYVGDIYINHMQFGN